MADATLVADLRAALGASGRILDSALDRTARGHDASHYELIPRAVVIAADTADVASAMRVAAEHGTTVTFRSGGTSLSGQGVTDDVLVDVRRGFRGIDVLDGGLRVRAQSGATVRQVNLRLAATGRKLGPDPASEIACTIGGVVANNSSGMACGTAENTYRTLESMTFVLPGGTTIDSAAIGADELLRRREPGLYATLERLRDEVRGDPAQVAEIERQFAMKNTMGYGLNALIDFDRPLDMLVHLIIGGEGTLAFVQEAVFRTVPLRRAAATALLVFDDLEAAAGAVPALVDTRAATLELMDAASLRVAQRGPDAPSAVRDLRVDAHAALLVEYQADDADALERLVRAAIPQIDRLPLAEDYELSGDAEARAALWHLRKGLYATVAGARPTGTTALLEDIVVPVSELARTCVALTALFTRHGYDGSVIFGHARDGNIHFMLTDRFDDDAGRRRLGAFTDDLVDLVLAHGGSLKAEHGTGRAMAPFVERQYGRDLFRVMREIKDACDPGALLNPGVVLPTAADSHLRRIKSTPSIEPEADRCVECGYCEPVCPSRDLTLTPRQRIVARRAIARARLDGDDRLAEALEADYDYDGLHTCAVDGMCQTSCPVLINTGDLVKRLRSTKHSAMGRTIWDAAARHWSAATATASLALSTASSLGPKVVVGPNRAARAVLGAEALPLWSPDLPAGGGRRGRSPVRGASAGGDVGNPAAVYFPTCQSAMFAAAGDGPGLQGSFEELCARAGVPVATPASIDSLCCGTPWSSKGFERGYESMRSRVQAAVREATRDGELPIVCDASSCSEGLQSLLAGAETAHPLRVIDAVDFIAEAVLPSMPRLEDDARIASITVHPTCSSTRSGATSSLLAIASAIARTVNVPADWGCCGFAGDRGMLHPELTASATAVQAEQVRRFDAEEHVSCNRACELGMSRATGRRYRGIIEVLADILRR